MKTWNVLIPVVELIVAETAEDAQRILAESLQRFGFEPYEEGRDAFESEPLT
jgi:ParB-like chromosome segregation protein Spo0J